MIDPKDLGRIGVLAGGPSNEREISLESGKAVFSALEESGANAVFLDVKGENSVKEQIIASAIDVAFLALHGRFGEDGTIQGILEEMRVPYTGSGPLASRLALDKIASREIFIKYGICVPDYSVFTKDFFKGSDLGLIAAELGFPLVVKPQMEGSSIGISIVSDEKALKRAADIAFLYGEKIIIEKYIKGREVTVAILDEEPLPVIEVVVGEQFYNFEAKYKSDKTRYIVPAKIEERFYKTAQGCGRKAHLALGCRSFSRVDMMLDEKHEKIFVLEVNSIPGFTSHSLLPKAAACTGIGFTELCLRIIESALKRAQVDRIGH